MGINDGKNLFTLHKDESARRATWVLLRANALLTQGVRFRDMPAHWFENVQWNNALQCNLAVFRTLYLADKHDLAAAKVFAEHLLTNAVGMADIHRNGLLGDLLFYELLGECRPAQVAQLYTKQLKNYLKATSSYPSHQLLHYAHALLFLRDPAQAEKARYKFHERCTNHSLRGELPLLHEMMQLVDEIAEKRRGVQG